MECDSRVEVPHFSLTCATPVSVWFWRQTGGTGVLGEPAERELRAGGAAPAVPHAAEGVGMRQAAPLHRARTEESGLGGRELVVALVLLVLVLLLQVHGAAPEGVQGEAGAAAAGCGGGGGGGGGVVLSKTCGVSR